MVVPILTIVPVICHFFCLNVCGLKSKLLIPEFCEYISSYGISVCLETKLDDLDRVESDNNTFLSKVRKQKTARSGGIGVFVKNSISPYL